MADPKTVTLTHPDSDQKVTVREDMVDTYRGQGWQTAEDKKADTA